MVKTIEHLLCSMYLNKIDNLLIETLGIEIPILDGNIFEFNKIFENNIIEIDKYSHGLEIKQSIQIEDYQIIPSPNLQIYCYIHDSKSNTKTFLYWEEGSPLIPAKTFGYLQDYPILQAQNLAKGADIENTLILTLHKPNYTPFHLNYHKIIDFIGDIYTTNFPHIKGSFSIFNPNHTKNNMLAIYLERSVKHAENYI